MTLKQSSKRLAGIAVLGLALFAGSSAIGTSGAAASTCGPVYDSSGKIINWVWCVYQPVKKLPPDVLVDLGGTVTQPVTDQQVTIQTAGR